MSIKIIVLFNDNLISRAINLLINIIINTKKTTTYVSNKYDLKNDNSYIGKEFKLKFSEIFDDDDDDVEEIVIYRIEYLELTTNI